MSVQQSAMYETAEEMLHLMLAEATDGAADVAAYRSARAALLADASAKPLVPRFVRTCRDPAAFWAFIKAKYSGSGSYEARRGFLRDEFEPLLSNLERFESSPVDELVKGGAEVLDSGSVTGAWTKALERRHRDPDGAITAARTLLESVCKTILDDVGHAYNASDDLPKLYHNVSKALNLAAGDHRDEAIKRILGGATSVVEGLGNLRNHEGDAHGKGRASYRPSERHAVLAVNLAGSMAAFLMQTWEERRAGSGQDHSATPLALE